MLSICYAIYMMHMLHAFAIFYICCICYLCCISSLLLPCGVCQPSGQALPRRTPMHSALRCKRGRRTRAVPPSFRIIHMHTFLKPTPELSASVPEPP